MICRIYLLVFAITVLITTREAKAQSFSCSRPVVNTYQCKTQDASGNTTCSQSQSVYEPSPQYSFSSYAMYPSYSVACCSTYIQNYSTGPFCQNSELHDPAVLDRLKIAYPESQMLIASCQGNYVELSRASIEFETSIPEKLYISGQNSAALSPKLTISDDQARVQIQTSY